MSEPLKAGWPVFVENIFISVGLPAASDSYECFHIKTGGKD